METMKDKAKRNIGLNDLGRGVAALRGEIDTAIARVLDSGWYVMGPEHNAFEAELGRYIGVEHAIGVASGTDALQLALTALGVGRGSTVLTAANAGGYTSTAAEIIGAVPAYADVDESTHLLTVETIGKTLDQLERKPDAIVVTHLYGAVAEMGPIVELAADRGIPVVEDCAQSLGGRLDGEQSGVFGTIATFSFYPSKNLGGLGDGGAVATSDGDLAEIVRAQRQYGWRGKYMANIEGGLNSRLDELQAAILRVRLPHLDGWNARRREIHRAYEQAAGEGVRFVNDGMSEAFTGHLAVVEVDDRDEFRSKLADVGVRTDVHYPIPDHKQAIRLARQLPELPTTEHLVEKVVSLPMFPELTNAEVQRICAALADY